MSVQLRSLLEDVASAVDPVPLQRDPWRRAVRARRLGQLLRSAVALAVVVALVSGWLAWDRRGVPGGQPEPTQGASAPAIPSDLYGPPPWAQSLEEGEPFGRVAAFGVADWRPHLYSSERSAIYVVSATTGDYRFLDLRGLGDPAPGDTVALSPDGRYIAYSVDTPTPVIGTPGPASIMFWDAETGEVTRVVIGSARGSSQTRLSWSPDSNLVAFGVNRYLRPSGGYTKSFFDVAAVDTAEITIDASAGPTEFAGWTADSEHVVWGSWLPSFDVTTGRQSTLLSRPLDISVRSWAESPDAELWVAGGFMRQIRLVNVKTAAVHPLRVAPGRSSLTHPWHGSTPVMSRCRPSPACRVVGCRECGRLASRETGWPCWSSAIRLTAVRSTPWPPTC